MGYTTVFAGNIIIDPPLNEHEVSYLRDFNLTRRMDRENGPYFVKGSGPFGQGDDEDVRDSNRPPEGQPGLWCQWTVTEDGKFIEWDEGEKFYYAPEWMKYIVDHFLNRDVSASVREDMVKQDPRFEHFTFDHVCNGVIDAEGEESGDLWQLVVQDNTVLVAESEVVFGEPRPL